MLTCTVVVIDDIKLSMSEEKATEPIQALLVKKGLEEATKGAENFLGAVLGEPLKAIGGLITDQINSRRQSNLIVIVKNAATKLKDAGVNPKSVPLKIIHPLLEYCSLEEDPSMQERWANLLANAADPSVTITMSPAYADILRQLTSEEAQLLDLILKELQRKALAAKPTEVIRFVTYEELKTLHDTIVTNDVSFKVAQSNLFRNELIVQADKGDVELTELGFQFISACNRSKV